MKFSSVITQFSVDHPKLITGLMIIMTGSLALLAALPSIWPDRFRA
jgi:hypothetical protein